MFILMRSKNYELLILFELKTKPRLSKYRFLVLVYISMLCK
jgi:hypothetical protein